MAAGKRKSGSLVLVLVLIVIIGVVLVYLAMSGGLANIGQTPPTPTPNFDMVDIVVASQAIPRGNLISADVLTTIKYPLVEVPAGTFFSTVADAVGTKAKYNIEPGVPLTSNMVIKQNDGSLASFDIPAGMTAFSLSVSAETVVAYAPQKGDHVMVVGCMLLTDVDTQYQTRLPNNLGLTTSAGNAGSGTTALSIQPWSEGQVASQGRYEIDSSSNEPLYIVPSETQRPRLVCQTIIQDAMVLQLGNFALGAGMDASVVNDSGANASQCHAGSRSTKYELPWIDHPGRFSSGYDYLELPSPFRHKTIHGAARCRRYGNHYHRSSHPPIRDGLKEHSFTGKIALCD